MPVEARFGPSSQLSTRGLGGEVRAGGRAKMMPARMPTGSKLPPPKAKAKPADAEPNARLAGFLFWLNTPALGQELIYFRGELAVAAVEDAGLAELAGAIRAESNAGFQEISECGHERHFTTGSGKLAIVMRRGDGGEQVHVVRRLPPPQAPAES